MGGSLKYIVEFKGNRRHVYDAADDFMLAPGQYVIVQAERGEDMGIVRRNAAQGDWDEGKELQHVTRLATDNDIERLRFNRQKESESKGECLRFIAKHNLKMKLVDVEYQFDCNKITFYFTAEKRVDFRELVKDLAATFRTRIELRQIGVRDEAKRLGGYGICGKHQCCSGFLREFNTISTQMARAQNLALNPQKISGNCGRLLCCLQFEQGLYEKMAADYPAVGARCVLDKQQGTIDSFNIFFEKIAIKLDEGGYHTLGLSEYKRAVERGQIRITGDGLKAKGRGTDEAKVESRTVEDEPPKSS